MISLTLFMYHTISSEPCKPSQIAADIYMYMYNLLSISITSALFDYLGITLYNIIIGRGITDLTC